MKNINSKETKKKMHMQDKKNAKYISDEKLLYSGEKVISDNPVLIRRSKDNEKGTFKKIKSSGTKSGSHSLTALQSFRAK